MLTLALVLTTLAGAEPEDGAAVDAGPAVTEVTDAGVPLSPSLPLDGRIIDFFLDGGTAVQRPAWLHFTGTRVIPEEVYRHELHLPDDAEPTAQTAEYIEETLYQFLLQGGYELASVHALASEHGGIEVQIDEGQLEKVVFTGRLTFQTLRFRLELFIEQNVYNRPALERQIAQLTEKIGLPNVRWSLVPAAHPEHVGPQLESLGDAIDRLALVHAPKPYELWFYFEEAEWNTGPGLDLRSGYIDGLEVGLNYQGIGPWEDRWRVAASGGVGARYKIDDHSLYVAFSRALLEARWYSWAIGPARIGASFTSNLFARQRRDLDVENYYDANAALALDTGIRLAQGAALTPAVGVQWRKVFDISPTLKDPDLSKVPPDSEYLRLFVELQANWTVDPKNPRWDRQHKIEIGGRYYFGRSLDGRPNAQGKLLSDYGWVYERYQKVFELGWHDLWVKSQARLTFGDVGFEDEQNLGELLRGVFGTFVRKAGNLEVEFRFSVSRDVLKLSFFTQFGAWGEVFDRINGYESLRVGIAAGPGFHALLLGMFQLDVYASAGFRTRWAEFHDNPFSVGLVVLLNKTY